MKNLLKNVFATMVIFVGDEKTGNKMRIIRENANHPSDKTIVKVVPMKDFSTFKYQTTWKTQWATLDPEKHIHNPQLYMIWNEKVNFIKEAASMNMNMNMDGVDHPSLDSPKWYLWLDIGCFRCRPGELTPFEISTWLKNEVVEQRLHPGKINFLQVGEFREPERIVCSNHLTLTDLSRKWESIGGCFAIPTKEIDLWHQRYYVLMKTFIDRGRFAGKEQTIFTNLTFAFASDVHVFGAAQQEQCCGGPYDSWFYWHKLLHPSSPKPIWYRIIVTLDEYKVSGTLISKDAAEIKSTIRSIANQSYPMWNAIVAVCDSDPDPEPVPEPVPESQITEPYLIDTNDFTQRSIERTLTECIASAAGCYKHKFTIKRVRNVRSSNLLALASSHVGCDETDNANNIILDYRYMSLLMTSLETLPVKHLGTCVQQMG